MRRLVPIVVLFFVGAPAALAWTWPVRGPVVQAFDFDQAHPYTAGQHRGIAIGADPGTTVVAPAPGTVSFVGSVPTSGKSVTIETSAGLSVTLTHLGSTSVTKGEWVDEGGAVGTVGPSGTPEVNVPYVHLGLRELARDQGYLDPLRFLPVPEERSAPVVPPPPVPAPAPAASAGDPTPTPAAPPPAAVATAPVPTPAHAGPPGAAIAPVAVPMPAPEHAPEASPSAPGITLRAAPAHRPPDVVSVANGLSAGTHAGSVGVMRRPSAAQTPIGVATRRAVVAGHDIGARGRGVTAMRPVIQPFGH